MRVGCFVSFMFVGFLFLFSFFFLFFYKMRRMSAVFRKTVFRVTLYVDPSVNVGWVTILRMFDWMSLFVCLLVA